MIIFLNIPFYFLAPRLHFPTVYILTSLLLKEYIGLLSTFELI